MNRSGADRAPTTRTPGAPARWQGAGRRAAAACAAAILLALLSACSQTATVQPVMAERCVQLGGERQEVTVQVPVRAAGLLHVEIRERGITAAASVQRGANRGHTATSPFRRWGEITLAEDAPAGGPATIRVSSVDTPAIIGAVCVSAEIIPLTRMVFAKAVRSGFKAGIATQDRNWQEAFSDYLAAARLYDGLHLTSASASARTAMAELAHRFLRRDRDSAALLGVVVSTSPPADPELLGARYVLLAKSLAGQLDTSPERSKTIERLLHSSTRFFQTSARGSRELPWTKILEGFLKYRDQDLAGARRDFEAAANECERLQDSECFAGARQNLAALAEDEQDYAEALADYEAALRVLDQSRSAMLAADISDNLGRLEGRIGLIQRGEVADRTAMQLYARLGDCDGARRAASTLGEMLAHIGSIGEAMTYLDYTTALDCRQLVSTLSESSQLAAMRSETVRTLPSTQWSSLDQPTACLDRPSLSDRTLEGDVAVFHALLAGSEIARLLNRPEDAARCLQMAQLFAATDVRSEIRLANANGQFLLQKGLPLRAQIAFASALERADSAGLSDSSDYRGTALLGLADVGLRTGALADARTYARTALRLSSGRADVSRVVAALQVLASIDRQSGDAINAQHLLRTAIRLIAQVPTSELDPETRAMYLATQHDVYAELTDLLSEETTRSGRTTQQAVWDAFAIADGGHARSIRYALDQSSAGSLSANSGGPAQGYRILMHQIANIAAESNARSSQAQLLTNIQELSLSDSARVAPELHGLASALHDAHATLLEYAEGQGSMFAFVVDEERIQLVKLGDLRSIDRAAAEFVAQLRSAEPDPGRIRDAARSLAEQVLWPVMPYIRHEHIFLVPAAALHTIPFGALPWSRTDARDLLVRHAEVSIFPSALFIERGRTDLPRRSQFSRFVLIGDPVLRGNIWKRTCASSSGPAPPPYSPFDWMRALPSLPGTRTEVLAVAKLVRQSRSSSSIVTLLGCAATPAALRADAPDAEFLHIATHGLVDARRPRLSALVLTPDSSPIDDGAVHLPDILEMKLHARLVVLSACDTSAGRLLPGEGVLGLAQAFIQSGARSVVASFWRVEDSTAGTFMEAFYRHLVIDRLPAAAALRKAQLDEATADDYGWAAFALYGRPDAML
jgi:CHAT domain-containing protein/tetratricopeptide (TPR) repeat protein